jgi:hypothetical protein
VSVTPDRRHAWQLVQIGELLRRGHRAHVRALARVEPIEVGAELSDTGAVVMSDEVAAELEMLAHSISDLAAQLQVLAGGLPDEPVEVAAEDARRDAARELSAGIFDETRARLAARTLPLQDGWPALASALRASEAHWEWEETTVAQLVGGFRGARASNVAQVLGDACLRPHLRFAACSPEQLSRLADALDRHAAS